MIYPLLDFLRICEGAKFDRSHGDKSTSISHDQIEQRRLAAFVAATSPGGTGRVEPV